MTETQTPTTPTPAPPRPGRRIIALTAAAIVAAAIYLFVNTGGNLAFAMEFRLPKLAALTLVGWSVAVSTVVFHTLTGNRILTPSLMGFDATYALLQTLLVFFLGAVASARIATPVQFLINTGVMMVLATMLFTWLFGAQKRSIHLLVLLGIVIGTVLRSVSTLLQMVMDPENLLVLQGRLFATFTGVDESLLGISAVLVGLISALIWQRRRVLDVMHLGRDLSICLGVAHRRETVYLLFLTAGLVSVSTALVGPILFFGLLVANLAYLVIGDHRHLYTLPAAGLVAIIALIGGQGLLEHVFGLGTVLSVIIEFVGGIVFIVMLIRGRSVA